MMVKELEQVVVRFSGDSGDGMQLAGNIFSTVSATVGNDISTFPDYPADIRAPQGSLTGVSGFQVHIGVKLVIKDCIADAFLQNTLLIPEEYSVVATLNLNGDYISDQLAAMVGGIGIAPGANINYNTGHAIFEATHGTAPNIAGKDVVNPCSLILSAVMMLEHFGWNKAAELIVNALESSFGEERATHDLARFMPGGVSLGTSAFTKEIIERINS